MTVTDNQSAQLSPRQPNARRFNPFTNLYYQNPYPQLRRLREEDPVHRAYFDMWVVTRYEDILEMLRDRRRFSADHIEHWESYKQYRLKSASESAFVKVEKGFVVFTEAEQHTRLRAAMRAAFAPSTIEHLQPIIQRTVETLLDRAAGDQIDIISDLAVPLATRTLCEVLGIEPDHAKALHEWVIAYNMAIEPIAGPAVLEAADRATESALELYRELQRTPSGAGENLARVLQASEEQGLINFDESFGLWSTIVLAGSATTINAIGNGLLALLLHPEEAAKLRADPSLGKNAVNELLRYDTPGMIITRAATEDCEFKSQRIDKGDLIMAFLGAANRDPEIFTDPDALRLDRDNANRQLAFGHATHFCVGEQIARIEIEAVARRFVERFPHARIASDDVRWVKKVHWRGLDSLPVQL